MSARFSFGRRSTDASTSTAASGSSMASSFLSVKGRAMSSRDKKQRKKESALVEEYYSMYELDWPVLRGWLQRRFPGIDFREDYDSSGDFYRFKLPQKLNETEKAEIYALRNDQNRSY